MITQKQTPNTYAAVDCQSCEVRPAKGKKVWVRVGTVKGAGLDGVGKVGACLMEVRKEQGA
jgi:hypothetical protein